MFGFLNKGVSFSELQGPHALASPQARGYQTDYFAMVVFLKKHLADRMNIVVRGLIDVVDCSLG